MELPQLESLACERTAEQACTSEASDGTSDSESEGGGREMQEAERPRPLGAALAAHSMLAQDTCEKYVVY